MNGQRKGEVLKLAAWLSILPIKLERRQNDTSRIESVAIVI